MLDVRHRLNPAYIARPVAECVVGSTGGGHDNDGDDGGNGSNHDTHPRRTHDDSISKGPGAASAHGTGVLSGQASHRAAGRARILYISLGAIFSAFVVEMTLGVISNSLALITDSIHALLDCVVTAVLLLAVRMAAKPPDAEHTYGHGKIESLGGMMGGIAIFSIACFFVYESLHRLQSPPPSIIPGVLAIAGGLYTIGIDVFRILLLKKGIGRGAQGGRDETTLKADLYHAVMDLGSTGVAIAGVALAYAGTYQGDLVAALVLGGLLAALSIKLIYRTALDLTDVISPDVVSRVRRATDATEGVIRTGPILMRRSGDTTFADITILLRGDASFEQAHDTSAKVEEAVARIVQGASVTVHFEPDWQGVPPDARILEIARGTAGVREVHNVNTHTAGGKTYADLHVMVSSKMSLDEAHGISEEIECKIKSEMPEIEHTTIHLEPFTTVPKGAESEDDELRERLVAVIARSPQVRDVGRIVALNYGGTFKVDIDCSFDGNMPIEEVHVLISEIELTVADEIGSDVVITIHPEPA